MLAGEGLQHTAECESVLAWMLKQAIEKGSWEPIQTVHTHPSLVSAGLLKEEGDRLYSLTTKAKGLLYAHYGKE